MLRKYKIKILALINLIETIYYFRERYTEEKNKPNSYSNLKLYKCFIFINTSGFATTHVVVSVRHPITY